MPKDTKTLGNNKARACESRGFVHKKGCARVLTQPLQTPCQHCHQTAADKGFERYRCWSADNLSKNFIETVCLESDF